MTRVGFNSFKRWANRPNARVYRGNGGRFTHNFTRYKISLICEITTDSHTFHLETFASTKQAEPYLENR